TPYAVPDDGLLPGALPLGFDSGVAKPLTVRLPNRFFGRRGCRGRPRLVTVISPFRFESTHHACPDEGDESGTSPPGFDSGVAKPLTVRLGNRSCGRRACWGGPPMVTAIAPFRFESNHHACPDEGDESGTRPACFGSSVAKPMAVRLSNSFFGRGACPGRPRLVTGISPFRFESTPHPCPDEGDGSGTSPPGFDSGVAKPLTV